MPAANGKSLSKRKDGLLTTGDMARLSNNTLRTVRFYEEMGLLEPEQRTDGGHRLFATTELEKLRLVSELRASGLSLEEIKHLLQLKRRSANGAAAASSVTARLDEQIASMNERIELLSKLKDELERARQLIAGCGHCDNDLFPDSCGDCEVMSKAKELPGAVSVLWQLNKR